MKSKLTLRQKELLCFIGNYICLNNCPPTLRVMSDYMGVSNWEVERQLREMRLKGAVTWKSRHIKTLILLGSYEEWGGLRFDQDMDPSHQTGQMETPTQPYYGERVT